MSTIYASDELVRRLMNDSITRAQYIYTYEESSPINMFDGIIFSIEPILLAVINNLRIRAEIYYAIVGGSPDPFQVAYLGDDIFVVLIDQRAFYYLLTLCLRIQSFPNCSREINGISIVEDRDYDGRYLLDITKDIVFNTLDAKYLLSPSQAKLVNEAALCFIIAHEVAHIAHGHLDFRVSEDYPPFSETDHDRELTHKALEMDADSSATTSVISVFEGHISRKNAEIDSEIENNKSQSILRRQYVLGIQIAQIFQDTISANHFPKYYPVGYTRYLNSIAILDKIIALNWPHDASVAESVRQAIVSDFVLLSGSLNNLAHPIATNAMIVDTDGNTLERIYSELGVAAGLEHLTPLHGRWAKLRPVVEKYLRGGRLAPAAADPN